MRNRLINSVPRSREAATPGPPAQETWTKQEAADEKYDKYLTGCRRHTFYHHTRLLAQVNTKCFVLFILHFEPITIHEDHISS